ncbi:MAG: RnfH family protein [Gammaproteobacteria bacterium]|nr:MAG: RnfH family protein [Gammaproteobacteria bacterium]UTW43567.1 RnfH family protein [bacterium SCSIO 12844]
MSSKCVEVCYALPKIQYVISVMFKDGMTIREIILTSDILNDIAELELDELIVGIFSKKKQLDDLVNAGDRIEIYRLLTIDPMEARRIRAEKKRKEKKLNQFGA